MSFVWRLGFDHQTRPVRASPAFAMLLPFLRCLSMSISHPSSWEQFSHNLCQKNLG